MKQTREDLKKLGVPGGDHYDLPDSPLRFVDGGQYRFEVPGIQGPAIMEALLEELNKYAIPVQRITQTKGIMLLSDAEIQRMVTLAKQNHLELVLAVGPRSTYDTSATVRTPEGQRMGLRLRGQEQIVRAIEDIRRAIVLGCQSFLLYDEGLLWALSKLRKTADLPKNVKFKMSAHTGHGNPCSAKLLEELGANSFNPIRDLSLPMLSSIRSSINIPIDLHTENPASSGGFIRHYEVPEMIRLCAPVFLKTGGSVAKTHAWDTTADQARQRAKQVHLVKRVIDQYYPEALLSTLGKNK